ncbi:MULTISPECIES: hypothetical protein [Trichocoleus]|uniref:Uncharacterized protein n=1 Tax=Trichocoleus desertorum GB2-A4 TaxID=2933944 RepID=A0ABV0JE50_9CYAN|nr:hypothetical protein [Trichocoleus sp. FACHB-46]MBD1862997.1 hypothetical protein [Trichocoleus sp. FACHB-46]
MSVQTGFLEQRYNYILSSFIGLAIALLVLSGPLFISVPIAAFTVGVDAQRIVLSGHRFQCIGRDPVKTSARCTTHLKGQLLELEFTYGHQTSTVLTQCNVKYGQQILKCSGGYDYRASFSKPFVYVQDNLGLTSFERRMLWLENPLINVSESDWLTLNRKFALVISILLGISIWLNVKLKRAWRIVLVSLSIPFLVVPTESLIALVLLFTGYVD